MTNSRLVYLVRHGDIGLNDCRKHYIGQIDLPLTEKGIRQAQRLSHELKGIPLSAVYCSSLKRSLETAQIIADAHKIPPVARDDLREISLGEWEGLTFDEVRERFPAEFLERGRDMIHYRPPGGESFLQCSRRVIAAIDEILNKTPGHLLIVGHAGVNRIALCHLLGLPLDWLMRFGQEPACLSILQQQGAVFRLEKLNATPWNGLLTPA